MKYANRLIRTGKKKSDFPLRNKLGFKLSVLRTFPNAEERSPQSVPLNLKRTGQTSLLGVEDPTKSKNFFYSPF